MTTRQTAHRIDTELEEKVKAVIEATPEIRNFTHAIEIGLYLVLEKYKKAE